MSKPSSRQNRSLRAVKINIDEIDAHALLKARYRVLLSDAADERAERRIGRAAGFQRHVGHSFGQRGNVGRTTVGQLIARNRGDRDRHVDQVFFAAARGDHDRGIFVIGSRGSTTGLRKRRSGGQADENAGDQ